MDTGAMMPDCHKSANLYNLWHNMGFARAGGDSKGLLDLAEQQSEGRVDAQSLCDVALQSLHVVQRLLADL